MSPYMRSKGYTAVEPDDICELCGKLAELRPYGPHGERVCFECGLKDKEAVERGMNRYLFGGGNV